MYLEQIETNIGHSGALNESVQAIGTNDAFKLNAIGSLVQKLAPEPSEVIVLSPHTVQSSFWSETNIPCIQDLEQIGRVLYKILDELHDRQKSLKCYGKTKHRIIVVIELDILHSALAKRAIELKHQYSKQVIDGAVEMLKEAGAQVGMFAVESITKPRIEVGSRLYSGTEAIKYVLDETTKVSNEVYQRITRRLDAQTHPCCLVVNEVVYPVEGITDRPVNLDVKLIPEHERAIEV